MNLAAKVITHRYMVSRTIIVSFGMYLLALYWVLRRVIAPDGVNISNIALGFLLLIATTTFFFGVLYRYRTHSVKLNSLTNFLFWAAALWFLLTAARGFTINPTRFLTWVANPEVGALVWLTPLAMLVGLNQHLFYSLMPVFYNHAVCGLVIAACVLLTLFFGVQLSSFVVGAASFLFYGVFFLLLSGWGTRNEKTILILCSVVWLVISVLIQSRTAIVLVGVMTVYALFVLRSNRFITMALRSFIFTAVSVLCAVIFLPALLDSLSDNWFIDTRTFLFIELFDDMSSSEVIFGRGALGEYYSPYFDMISRMGIEGGDSSVRQSIEIVYLHLILKSGLIGMTLYISLSLLAIYRIMSGVLNRFGFAVAAIILIRLVEMVSNANTFFSLQNLFFWMLVGVGLSWPRRREMVS